MKQKSSRFVLVKWFPRNMGMHLWSGERETTNDLFWAMYSFSFTFFFWEIRYENKAEEIKRRFKLQHSASLRKDGKA
jgi:hypothetical protein